MYFLITPYLLAPKWCMDYNRDNDYNFSEMWTVDCEAASGGKIRYSRIIGLSPMVTGIMDLVCIGFLLFYRLYKFSWSKQRSCKNNVRTIAIFTVGVLSIVNSIIAMLNQTFPLYVNICRPIIMILFFSSMRRNIFNILLTLWDSLFIIISIGIYVVLYSLVGYSMYRAEFQGMTNFSSFYNTVLAMFTLLTTANYPDVMLPAYLKNFWNFVFFLTFLTLGLYLFLNLLLANVFNMYQRRLTEARDDRLKKRGKIIDRVFDRFDTNHKGYLTYEE